VIKRTKWLLTAGALLAVLAVAVWLVGNPVMVRFPLNVDQTLRYTGTATVYANPTTGARLTVPLQVPLTIDRRIHVVSGGYSHAVVQETDAITYAGSTHTTKYQYYMNRRTMQLVNGPKSYAFDQSANVMTTAGAYRINFPLDTANRTYAAWAPETNSAATAKGTGASRHDPVSGDQVITFDTVLNHAVAPYYLTFLQSMGLPTSLSSDAVLSQLKVAGADPARVLADLAPRLSAAQQSALTTALAKPVPLSYSYFQQGQVTVQTKTGAVVGANVAREGVAVTPDLSGLAALQPILGANANLPAVQSLVRAASTLAAPQTVFSMAYRETPASIHAAASTANQQGARMNLVQWQLPIAIGALALLTFATAWLWRPRPRPGVTHEVTFGAPAGKKAA
jgi:hypothetical protein